MHVQCTTISLSLSLSLYLSPSIYQCIHVHTYIDLNIAAAVMHIPPSRNAILQKKQVRGLIEYRLMNNKIHTAEVNTRPKTSLRSRTKKHKGSGSEGSVGVFLHTFSARVTVQPPNPPPVSLEPKTPSTSMASSTRTSSSGQLTS